MIKEFVDIWNENKDEVLDNFKDNIPRSNRQIVKELVKLLNKHSEDYRKPDPERIHHIDDGHYQGTDVFVIGSTGYQPNTYWIVKQYYGSCAGCDVLLDIAQEYDYMENEEQAMKDLEKYTLNIFQSMKEI